MMRATALLLLGLVGACGIPENSPEMKPGEDCLSCHDSGSRLHWYAAGTVYADGQARANQGIQGAEVVITDANDRQITLKTNGAGNFYTAETLISPFKDVLVRYKQDSIQMPSGNQLQGACNSCHDGALIPRIHVP